ncbi:MAG: hypothetical protein R2771_07805 [Saprospiraceae bacterium]
MNNNFNQGLGVNVSVPIYSKGQEKTDLALAKITKEKSENDLLATKKVFIKIEISLE